jgi:Flp pilus assembly protein TadG
MKLSNCTARRTAAHAVEFAVVIPVVLLVLFGILEYCRFLMTIQLTDNAVREGARHALARTDTFQTELTTAKIQERVEEYMNLAGMQLDSPEVRVYKSNKYGQPLNADGTIVTDWKAAAEFDQTTFGDYICVKVIGNYKPVMPDLLSLSSTMKITATAVMVSEGN